MAHAWVLISNFQSVLMLSEVANYIILVIQDLQVKNPQKLQCCSNS